MLQPARCSVNAEAQPLAKWLGTTTGVSATDLQMACDALESWFAELAVVHLAMAIELHPVSAALHEAMRP